VIAENDEYTAMKPSSVVSRIKRTEMPSTPTWYLAPTAGIQSRAKVNWNAGPAGSYTNQSGSERTKSSPAITVATVLIALD
jgi:hypothetical protein